MAASPVKMIPVAIIYETRQQYFIPSPAQQGAVAYAGSPGKTAVSPNAGRTAMATERGGRGGVAKGAGKGVGAGVGAGIGAHGIGAAAGTGNYARAGAGTNNVAGSGTSGGMSTGIAGNGAIRGGTPVTPSAGVPGVGATPGVAGNGVTRSPTVAFQRGGLGAGVGGGAVGSGGAIPAAVSGAPAASFNSLNHVAASSVVAPSAGTAVTPSKSVAFKRIAFVTPSGSRAISDDGAAVQPAGGAYGANKNVPAIASNAATIEAGGLPSVGADVGGGVGAPHLGAGVSGGTTAAAGAPSVGSVSAGSAEMGQAGLQTPGMGPATNGKSAGTPGTVVNDSSAAADTQGVTAAALDAGMAPKFAKGASLNATNGITDASAASLQPSTSTVERRRGGLGGMLGFREKVVVDNAGAVVGRQQA